MKKPAIQISIPEPCQQSWDEMTQVKGGKHCAHCQKTVVDFTKMTDAQIIVFLQSQAFGCGRFRGDQLGRDLVAPAEARRFNLKWLLSFLMIFLFSKDGIAQERTPAKAKTHQAPVSPQKSKTARPAEQAADSNVQHADQIEVLGKLQNHVDIASLPTGVYEPGKGQYLHIGGGRVASTTYIIDGVQYPDSTARKPSIWKRLKFWKRKP